MLKKIIFLFTVIVVISFINYFIDSYTNKEINQTIEKYNKSISKQFEILNYYKSNSADTMMKTIQRYKNGEIINIFSKASKTKDKKQLDFLRLKLQKLLKNKYNMMKNRGVFQFQFIFSNNITFLRMHKPSKFGDDLSNIRKDVVEANKKQIIVRGLSAGKTSHGFRNIYPVFNKSHEFLGVVSIDYSSEFFQNILTNVDRLHTHFLINHNVVNKTLWNKDDSSITYQKSAENEDFLLALTKNHSYKVCITQNNKKLSKYKQEIYQKMIKNKLFGIYVKDDDKFQILSFYPIKESIENKTLGWIVAYHDSSEIEYIYNNKIILNLLAFIVLLLLFIFIYFILNQKENLKKLVDEKTKDLNSLNENLEKKVIIRTQQLESSNIQLKNVLHSSNLGYWEWNLQTSHLDVNDRWLEIIGMKREDFKNNIDIWKNNVHMDDLSKVYKIINCAFENKESFNVEFRMKHSNGKYIWIEGSGAALEFDNDNKPLKAYGIHKQIQEKKENELKLQHQEKIIQNQAKVNAISDMLINISHQWRQPLTIISTSVSGLKLNIEMGMDVSNEQLDECADTVIENSQYLSKTIDDFTSLFKNNTGESEHKNIETVFEKLQNISSGSFKAHNVKCIIDIKSEIYINTDISTFTQSIINITNNSVDAFNKNNIPEDQRFIFIDVLKKNKSIIITIKDNAGGIDENIIDNIFEPYFTTKHQSVGTGIGLYMTYNVITKHLKGSIEVENIIYEYNNKKYKGAVFTISI